VRTRHLPNSGMAETFGASDIILGWLGLQTSQRTGGGAPDYHGADQPGGMVLHHLTKQLYAVMWSRVPTVSQQSNMAYVPHRIVVPSRCRVAGR
jgi:hypothetical protein